jgi:hypothetical protein
MPPVEVLGYINQFVEHDGYRVVILANEEKVIEKDPQFISVKEKVVGRTFRIQSQTKEALNSFLDELLADDAIEVLKTRKSQMLAVEANANYDNLRHLRQAVHDFADFWHCLPVEKFSLKTRPAFLDRLVKDVIAISLETRSGTLPISSIDPTTIRAEMVKRLIANNSKEPVPKSEALTRLELHGLDSPTELALLPSVYIEFFNTGWITEETAIQGTERSPFIVDDTKPAWIRLWYRYTLSDQDFEEVVAQVRDQLSQATFESAEILLHVAGMLFDLAHKRWIPESMEQISVMVQDAVRALEERTALSPGSRESALKFDADSSLGLGYTGRDLTEFQKFRVYLQNARDRARESAFVDWARELMEELTNTPETWASKFRVGLQSAIYSHQPIFAYSSADKFVETLMHAQPVTLQAVSGVMNERYGLINLNDEWKLKELDFLSKSADSFKLRLAETAPATLSRHMLREWLLPALDKAIVQLTQLRNPASPPP